MQFTIQSRTSTRVRFVLDAGFISAAEARGLAYDIMALEGVARASVHPANMSLIVEFDDAQNLSHNQLHNQLHNQAVYEVVCSYLANTTTFSLPAVSEPALNSKALAYESLHEHNTFMLNVAHLLFHRVIIHSIPLPLPLFFAWIAYRAWFFIRKGIESLAQKELRVEVLDACVIAISIGRGELASAGTIMFLLSLSDCVQQHVQARTKLSLKGGIVSRSQWVWKRVLGEDVKVALESIVPGDEIHVLSGASIPVDGVVVQGAAEVNEASLTGESRLVHKDPEDSVYAGTALESGDIIVRTTAQAGNSRIDSIVEMVEESAQLKAQAQSKAERLADGLVPYSFIGFFVVGLLTRNIRQALSVLMVDYSCAIKLSVPIAIASAMDEMVKNGIVVKGGKFFEAMSAADMIVFDKTGTLTRAVPELVDVISFCELPASEILRIAACIEEHFPHSVARAITSAAAAQNLDHTKEVHTKVEYVVAHGIKTHVTGKVVCVGSSRFVFDVEHAAKPANLEEQLARVAHKHEAHLSYIYMSYDKQLAGVLCINDPLRADAAATICALKDQGFSRVVMLTGDSEHIAAQVASALHIDEYKAQVLPEDKLAFIKQAQREGYTVAMVGDGINDSPALAQANVSIALSDASDIARAVADISIHNQQLHSLVVARTASQLLMQRVHNGFVGIVGVNSSLILLGLLGIMSPIHAAYIHNGYTFALTLANMRGLLRAKGDDVLE